MTIVDLALPLVAGLLVGTNPYTAPYLRARLDETRNAKRVITEAAGLSCAIATATGVAAWEFAPFISGRLTNGLLIFGLLTLAGAVYAIRPIGRRRDEPAALPSGWRWTAKYASDLLYFGGPAWLVATAISMRTVRALDFASPYALAALGATFALVLWVHFIPQALPASQPRAGESTPRATKLLALAYGAAGALVLAGNVGLV